MVGDMIWRLYKVTNYPSLPWTERFFFFLGGHKLLVSTWENSREIRKMGHLHMWGETGTKILNIHSCLNRVVSEFLETLWKMAPWDSTR